ncbi:MULTISPECIES: GHKL domain-containing protein, partial [Blautia]
TTKTDTSNHGIGLPSVRRAADKYQGVLSVDTTEPGRFLARVVLYGS